jgi:hypothetical protein
MSVNGASTIFCPASWIIQGLCKGLHQKLHYWLPLWAQRPATISLPPPKHERQWSINDFLSYMLDNSRAVQRYTPIIIILAAYMGKNVGEAIATTT